ncbi:MAG: hypothetical protein WC869_07850 [Phycisphaerae bacterium]|jgi:hypothetical protein
MEVATYIRSGIGTLAVFLAVLAACASPASSQSKPGSDVPQIDIPALALRASLLAAHKAMVDQYVKYWVAKMVDAKSDKELLDGRTGLVAGYRKYDSTRYQMYYAEQAIKAMSPLLTSEDPRKQVNAGIVISGMRQVAIQPALETMVKSPNPALRFYGWRGYQRIRMWVLAQGRDSVGQMMSSLVAAAAHETSAPVLKELFKMLWLEPDRPSMVSEQEFEQTRLRLFGIARDTWPRMCRGVLGRDADLSDASREGLLTLRAIYESLGSNKEVQQAVMQMVVDMMWCAAKSYSELDIANPVFGIDESLLRDSEAAMNAITKLRKTPMDEALASKGEEDRRLAVRVAVQTWIRGLENAGFPVSEPTRFGSAATNPPATSGSPAE